MWGCPAAFLCSLFCLFFSGWLSRFWGCCVGGMVLCELYFFGLSVDGVEKLGVNVSFSSLGAKAAALVATHFYIKFCLIEYCRTERWTKTRPDSFKFWARKSMTTPQPRNPRRRSKQVYTQYNRSRGRGMETMRGHLTLTHQFEGSFRRSTAILFGRSQLCLNNGLAIRFRKKVYKK